MTIRIKSAGMFMRAIESDLPGSLPKPGEVIALSAEKFNGHFRVDDVEMPMTGNNPHRSIPLLYVHSMSREF